MTTDHRHLGEQIHDLIDGRLRGDARQVADRHLETCPECRRAWEAALATRAALRSTVRATELPSGLVDRVGAALDEVDQTAEGTYQQTFELKRRAVPMAAVAAVIIVTIGVGLWLLSRPDLPTLVARDFTRYQASTLPLESRATTSAALEAFFRSRVGFTARVFDLAMMRYELVGGRVHALSGRPSALFVYRGDAGRIVLCQMYPGTMAALSAPDETRLQNDITFYIYRRDGYTLVFWQEGDVTCVLVSDIPSQETIQLAFAKAMKPPNP